MKKCSRCGRLKPLDAFNRKTQLADGRASACRECTQKAQRGYRSPNAQANYERWRSTHIKEARERAKNSKRNASPEARAKIRAQWRRYFDADRSKHYARVAVYRAIKEGKLKRPNRCSLCNERCKPEAHHYAGYDIPNRLKVRWVCSACHKTL